MNIRQTHYHAEVMKPLFNEKRFNDKQRDRAYLALFKFGTLAIEPDFSDDCALDLWWEMAKGTIERLNSRRWNGTNGGRPPENEQSGNEAQQDNPIKNNQTETKPEPNDNQSETETKPPVPEPIPVPVTSINLLAGSPPASNSSSPKPLADLLDDRLKAAITRFSTPKSEFYYPWQEKAARYAIKIGLDLTKTVNGSQIGGQWFSLFKRSNGNANGKLANLEGAYQHFVDNPKSFDDPSKFLIFCDIYHHGRESVLNKNKQEGRS